MEIVVVVLHTPHFHNQRSQKTSLVNERPQVDGVKIEAKSIPCRKILECYFSATLAYQIRLLSVDFFFYAIEIRPPHYRWM